MLTSKLKRSALDAELFNNSLEDIENSTKRSRSDNGYENVTSSDEEVSPNKVRSDNRTRVTSPLATVATIASLSRSSSPPPKLLLMQSNGKGNSNTQEFKKFYNDFIEEVLDLALEENNFENLDSVLSTLQSQKVANINTLHVSILLKNLSKRITKLEKSPRFKPVIENLILLEGWHTVTEHSFLQNYILFLKLLCSGLPKYISKVTETLIVQLCDYPLSVTKEKHHIIFAYLLNGFPTFVNDFLNTLIRSFPNKNDTQERNVHYLENVLEIMRYCREGRYSIMALLIEKMISIDVELQNEIEEEDSDDEDSDDESSGDDEDESSGDDDEEEDDDDDEDEEEEDFDDMTNDEKVDVDSDQDSEYSESDNERDGSVYLSGVISPKTEKEEVDEIDGLEEEEAYDVDESNNIKDLTLKLDVMLTKMSEFFKENLSQEKLESGEGIEIFTNLKSIFKSHILPTYYTKSIQYLIFHASQEQQELMDSYLVTLLDIAFSKVESIENRVKALQFISSYVARAKNLSKGQILFVTTYLVTWLNRYVVERELEIDEMPGSMERFEHLYAAFQALCYIFCFRHDLFKLKTVRKEQDGVFMTHEEELASKISDKSLKNGDSEWECDLDRFYQRIILSKFNPLKYCNENVILMFASIAQKVNLVYCYTVIERNNKDNILGIINNDSINSAGVASDSTGSENGPQLSTANPTLSVRNTTSIQKKQFIDLQSYFPFDPLFLPVYREFIKDCYIEWTDVAEKDGDNDEQE